jgi:hypothetical protein
VRADGVVGEIVPIVPEAGSPISREGLARRRQVLLDGRCPCGAVPLGPQRGIARPELEPPLVIVLPQHHDDCAAVDDGVEDWVDARWGWSA